MHQKAPESFWIMAEAFYLLVKIAVVSFVFPFSPELDAQK